MDIFSLDPVSGTYANGELINDIYSKLWIERYRDAGEFKFIGFPTNELRTALALGTLISHRDTPTVMRVEDHEIIESPDKPPELTITGRSIEAFMEHRVATNNSMGFAHPNKDGTPSPYTFTNTTTWAMIVDLMQQHLETGSQVHSGFDLPNVHVVHTVTDTETIEDRDVKRGVLYSTVLDLLDEFQGGIKIERPFTTGHSALRFVIHQGNDLSATIRFTTADDEISSARYFWSNRPNKNVAYIMSRYGGYYLAPGSADDLDGWDKAVLLVDANDINTNPIDAGWGADIARDKLNILLKHRGQRKLKHHAPKVLTEASVYPNSEYVFRRDYDIGDKVFVKANYGVSTTMRVTEFAETEDESGEYGYPTLSVINPV